MFFPDSGCPGFVAQKQKRTVAGNVPAAVLALLVAAACGVAAAYVMCLVYHEVPVVDVWLYAILYVAQFVVELLAYWAWFAVLADDVAFAGLGVVDLEDRADDCSRAAGSCLLEGAELVFGNLAALHLESEVEGQLLEALVGDGGQDGGRLGSDVGVVFNAEEVGGTALVDVFLLLGVEVELAGVTRLVGLVVGAQAGGVVASYLIYTCAEGCGAVVLARDAVVGAGKASLEVGAYRGDEDEEEVLRGGVYSHLGAGAYHERAQVEGGAALVGRNEALVELDDLLGHLDEEVGGHLGHHDAARGALHAGSVFVDAEDANLAVGAAEGFLALKRFLSVVEAGGCHVQVDCLRGADFNFSPFAVAVAAAHVVVGAHVGERKFFPIYRFHIIIMCFV